MCSREAVLGPTWPATGDGNVLGIRAMSVGSKIEVARNKLLCIAQFLSWLQMTFAKKKSAKALFLFETKPKNRDTGTQLEKMRLTIHGTLS